MNYLTEFTPKYIEEDWFAALAEEVPWIRVKETPRMECFMAVDPNAKYSYGNSNADRTRVYEAKPMHPLVRAGMDRLNRDFDCRFNVCVLNRYMDERDHLGWHADDSPEQDLTHPIAVVAFGAEREIWIKVKSAKGAVPDEDRYLMTRGGLFIMPPGFQEEMAHRIPKCDRPCGGRISLTFRKLDRNPDGSPPMA